jgi:hypothetical protein
MRVDEQLDAAQPRRDGLDAMGKKGGAELGLAVEQGRQVEQRSRRSGQLGVRAAADRPRPRSSSMNSRSWRTKFSLSALPKCRVSFSASTLGPLMRSRLTWVPLVLPRSTSRSWPCSPACNSAC